MKTILVIIAALAGGWFLLIFGLRGMAALLRKSAVKAVNEALEGEEILKMTDNASFLGSDFPGPNLPPGTSGVLAVTRTRVIFLPWFPRRTITLPRDSIAEVSLKDRFDEKAYNIPVLLFKVRGVGDPHGKMAWLVHEAGEWERVISSILSR